MVKSNQEISKIMGKKHKNSDENQGSQVSIDKKRRRGENITCWSVGHRKQNIALREKMKKCDFLDGFWKIFCRFFTW